MLRSTILLLCALCLCGCAGKRCLGERPYEKAKSVPPLHTVEGLRLPQSTAALKIPPEPANPVPYGQKVKDDKGEEVVQCLERPPPMPKVAEQKPVEPKPTEPTPTEPKPPEAKPAEKSPS